MWTNEYGNTQARKAHYFCFEGATSGRTVEFPSQPMALKETLPSSRSHEEPCRNGLYGPTHEAIRSNIQRFEEPFVIRGSRCEGLQNTNKTLGKKKKNNQQGAAMKSLWI